MFFLETMKRIQELTEIPYHELAPVVFGNDISWQAAGNYILASKLIPNQSGLLILRTECYTTVTANGTTEALLQKATPGGFAYWTMANLFSQIPTGNDTDLTDKTTPANVILDTECFLLAVAGAQQYLNLIGILDASPDNVARRIRTQCYGFLIPGEIYERLRNQFYTPTQNA